KAILLLIVIYISFIALGLPDALLGSAWNYIRSDLKVSLGTLGIMTFIVYLMSIIATYNAPRLLRFFETKKITFISVFLTGIALVIMSQVTSFYQMLFFALPLGMGAGAIDVSLNHYLAKNYQARHMSYLHSFYGIGVTVGPTIMAYTLSNNSWRLGYIAVGSILLVISLIMFISFPLWKNESKEDREEEHAHITLKDIIKTKGATLSVLIFLVYVHIESLSGVWVASYFYIVKETSYATAALFTTSYYLALTIGRLLSGLLSYRLKPQTLIKIGQSFILVAALLMFLTFESLWIYAAIVFLLGLGSGPIYPNMMYVNGYYFERKKMSKIISMQMVIGYMGFGLLTPLAGLFFDKVSILYYPIFLLVYGLIMSILLFYYFKKMKYTNYMETKVNDNQ
ncbi:MAG: MFS transporter, partial [Acholeplasmataceae bacterium]|nr:MFS transporter [Acholeplasmataceae bacterium]